jgi:hypothetical protein
MIKIALYTLSLSLLLFTACEKKPAETEGTTEVDSLKKDTVSATADTTTQVAATELSEKAAMVAGKWKATEFETPNIKLSGELIDIRFDFKPDMTFEYSEDGKKDNGTWKLNEQENQVMLTYQNDVKADMDIKELTKDKFVLAGKEHGMYRTYILAPAK